MPRDSTATRSPIVIASIWSWVTYTVVTLSACWSLETSARIWTRSLASRFDSGSSIRNACGWRTIARPIATRWRWPPDSWPGLRSRFSVSSRILAALSTRSLISALGIFFSLSAKAMLSRTVRCGYRAYDWNTMAMSRSLGSRSFTTLSPMRNSPDVIVSSPAIIRSAVDLPQPDGPTSTKNSPSATSSDSLCTA